MRTPIATPVGLLCLALSPGCGPVRLHDQRGSTVPTERPRSDAAASYRPEADREGAPPVTQPAGALYRDLRRHTESGVGADYDPDIFQDDSTGRHLIVFASTRHDPQGEIYLKDVNRPALRRLTNSPTRDAHPKFSPDGRLVAFSSDRNGDWDIFVISATESGPSWQVTDSGQDDVYPTWSPDGRRLAYSSRDGGGDWTIWIRDLATSELVNLGPGLFPEWSPDGERLAFQRPSARGPYWYSVWTVRVNGNDLSEVVASDEWAAINPSWSPDGSWLVFASVAKSRIARQEGRVFNGDDVWMVREDGTQLVQLTVHPGADWNPTWGPRDGRIYFCSDREWSQNLWSCQPVSFPVRP
ncbi:MAG: TolB family protein [Planctomycetes bacterium]|nr:TolB family protein [Planctomycetota bacterium]